MFISSDYKRDRKKYYRYKFKKEIKIKEKLTQISNNNNTFYCNCFDNILFDFIFSVEKKSF